HNLSRGTGSRVHHSARFANRPVLDRTCRSNGRDAQGRTPLLIATSQQDWKTAHRLLDAGALVDLADKNGFTPLMAAAMYGNAETFQLLLARTDNLHAEAPTNDGRDLLGMAHDGGHR